MTEKTLDQLIEETKKEHESEHRVAFIGRSTSGKTVLAVLFKHTLMTSWIPSKNGKWLATASSGHDEINRKLLEMKRGSYTSPTLQSNYPELTIDVHDMRGHPATLKLILHDMSGENYIDLLADAEKYAGVDDRLYAILNGDGKYLAYANKYIIIVDCSKKDEWDADDAKLATVISTIKTMKHRIYGHGYEKLLGLIGIVFTKTDLLSTEDQAKSAKDLVKDYPDLDNTLKLHCHMESVEFFKVSVSSVSEDENERRNRIEREKQVFDMEYKQEYEAWDKRTKAVIAKTVSDAEVKAQNEGKNQDQIRSIANSVRSKTQEEYDAQFKEDHPHEKPEHSAKWKINVPLVYSDSEYARLISWLLGDDDG